MSTGFEQAATDVSAASAPTNGTFEEAAKTNAAAAPQNPTATVLEDGSVVVGGKIYKPEAAAKKIDHADAHITRLERENAEKDAQTLDLLERIQALEANRNHKDALDTLLEKGTETAKAPTPPVAPESPPTQEISKDEIVQTVHDTIKAEQVAAQQEANLAACVAAAQEAFGEDFGTKIDAAGVEHNMSLDQIMEMARNQPTIFKKLYIPAKGPNGSPDTTRSSLNGLPLGTTASTAKPKSYMGMNASERTAEIKRRMALISTTG